jgi:dTDP-4-amino-4,6-dideoxygalactose transaminase
MDQPEKIQPVPFNIPYISGNELRYIRQVMETRSLAGGKHFTQSCLNWFTKAYKVNNGILTSSCTDALEICALLMDLKPGDEVIAPSYTFVSSVNPFVLQGCKIVFADSYANHSNIDPEQIEKRISKKTKAILVVHYGGVACDMGKIRELAHKHRLYIIEDAAHSIDATYNGVPLGTLGDAGAFSFHETKNITCGEGGLLSVNRSDWVEKAELIKEKGTNRMAFLRKEIKAYQWVSKGSSYTPSEITAAFLYAQLQHLKVVQEKRLALWNRYHSQLKDLSDKGRINFPAMPSYASNNAHLFYFMAASRQQRDQLIAFLLTKKIEAQFHYQCLHKSQFYLKDHPLASLPHAERFEACLVRLPLYADLTHSQVSWVCEQVNLFYS